MPNSQRGKDPNGQTVVPTNRLPQRQFRLPPSRFQHFKILNHALSSCQQLSFCRYIHGFHHCMYLFYFGFCLLGVISVCASKTSQLSATRVHKNMVIKSMKLDAAWKQVATIFSITDTNDNGKPVIRCSRCEGFPEK